MDIFFLRQMVAVGELQVMSLPKPKTNRNGVRYHHAWYIAVQYYVSTYRTYAPALAFSSHTNSLQGIYVCRDSEEEKKNANKKKNTQQNQIGLFLSLSLFPYLSILYTPRCFQLLK